MRSPHPWIIAALAVFVLFACTSGTIPQQRTPDGGLYFSETGISLSGEYLTFFQQADQPLLEFGFPISTVMDNPLRPGTQIQYFQRARMELDPSKPEGQRVTLAPLGTWLYDKTKESQDANIDTSSAACRYFEQSGHPVCFAFLQFYDAHNGAFYFGNPISEVILVDGRMVQYFERARLEWWPERAIGSRVVLTNIGTMYLKSADPTFGTPVDRSTITGELPHLNVRVFAAKPVIGANETQTVFVIVQDQNFHPISKAKVKVVVRMPDGSPSTDRANETNDNGLTSLENIPLTAFQPDQMVAVDVTVNATGMDTVQTTTWFRVWW